MSKSFIDLVTKVGMWLLLGFAFVVGSMSTVTLAQWIEHEYQPVIADFQVNEIIHAEDGSIAISGSMRKVRNCEMVGLYAFSGARTLLIGFEDGQVGSRPLGVQSWGPWRLRPDTGAPLRIYSSHRCHPFWLSTTDLLE